MFTPTFRVDELFVLAKMSDEAQKLLTAAILRECSKAYSAGWNAGRDPRSLPPTSE